VHSATDITGFGLSGHSWQMSRASGHGFRIIAESLPILPLAAEHLNQEFLTKAHRTNREYTQEHIRTEGLENWRNLILHDPQTSGGLLMSVAAEASGPILRKLEPHFPGVAKVGEVLGTAPGVEFV